MNYKENRGSEWRKWDLHVHTPESGMNNQFGKDENAWDEYVKALFSTAIENEVAVIGITDYFLIDGYKKLKNEYLSNRPRLLSLFGNDSIVDKVLAIKILPNIEFRLDNIGKSGDRINFHVLLSDELSTSDIEDLFLSQLLLQIAQNPDGCGESYICNRRGLEKIGEIVKTTQEGFDGSDYEIGCQVAVVNKDKITSTLSANAIFKGKYIIAIPVDEDLSAISWNSQAHLIRKQFYQMAHAFFTANPKTHNFALGMFHETPKKFLEEFKSFKPCFVGSDAHSINDIKEKLGQWKTDRPDQSKITWIKADPTFSGLLQTVYEPETRVHIQSSKPEVKTDMCVISSVQMRSDNGAFDNKKILLNDNLNAIIGGKSSGKSLLLSSIAKATNREIYEKNNSILNLCGYDIVKDAIVEWKDGTIDRFATMEPTHTIAYIPQLYINYLAERQNQSEFNDFILKILLQNQEFKAYYEQFCEYVRNKDEQINNSLEKLFEYIDRQKDYRDKIKEIGTPDIIQKSIETTKERIKEITDRSLLTEDEKTDYANKLKAIEDINKEIAKLNYGISFVRELRELLNNRIGCLVGKINGQGEDNVPGEIDKIRFNYVELPREIDGLIAQVKHSLSQSLNYATQAMDELTIAQQLSEKKSIKNSILTSLEPLNKKLEEQKEIEKYRAQLNDLNSKLTVSSDLANKLITVNNEYVLNKTALIAYIKQRIKAYDNLAKSINETYSNIDKEIRLESQICVDRESLTLYEIINKQRTTSHFFNSIFPEEGNINHWEIPTFFENIKGFKDGELTFKDETKCNVNKDKSIKDVFKSLTENEMKIRFDIKYKNDNLQQMSPGKKGTVLLILFLQISSAQYPILIDQPEDNLDNRTVYNLLCTMIKRKKSERQIIIVTHNANLVVGTDSENVIVANQAGQNSSEENTSTYQFEYVNGPIECSFVDNNEKNELQKYGIKEHVCGILEGGVDAFAKREQKYSL